MQLCSGSKSSLSAIEDAIIRRGWMNGGRVLWRNIISGKDLSVWRIKPAVLCVPDPGLGRWTSVGPSRGREGERGVGCWWRGSSCIVWAVGGVES
jgi:hypothetical protein